MIPWLPLHVCFTGHKIQNVLIEEHVCAPMDTRPTVSVLECTKATQFFIQRTVVPYFGSFLVLLQSLLFSPSKSNSMSQGRHMWNNLKELPSILVQRLSPRLYFWKVCQTSMSLGKTLYSVKCLVTRIKHVTVNYKSNTSLKVFVQQYLSEDNKVYQSTSKFELNSNILWINPIWVKVQGH